jgi:hypothetical protein
MFFMVWAGMSWHGLSMGCLQSRNFLGMGHGLASVGLGLSSHLLPCYCLNIGWPRQELILA